MVGDGIRSVPENRPAMCGNCHVYKSGPFHWMKRGIRAMWVCYTCYRRLSDDG